MRFYKTILTYPKSVIGVILAITVFFGWQMGKVKMNNSIEALLPENHPSVVQDREVKHVFNSREMILVGIIDEEDGVFNPRTLQKVKDLAEQVWQITIVERDDEGNLSRWGEKLGEPYRSQIHQILADGLTVADRGAVSNLLLEERSDSKLHPDFLSFLELLRLKLAPISDVISLADVDNITSTEWGLNIGPPMDSVPQTKEDLTKLTETIFNNEMFVNGLVSEDSTGTVIFVELAFYYDEHLELAHAVFKKLEALAVPYNGPEQVMLAGVPMVNVYTSNYMSGDLAKLMPIVIVVVMLVMYFSLRMLKGMLIPLAVVLVALVWTLGVMGMFGRPMTLVVSVMPIILIAIGIADGIHLMTEYKMMWSKLRNHDQAILATMRQLTMPVIFTSLTDMAGFASLTTSSLRSIKDFGLFTSVGVFAALVFSLTFIPAALKLMKPPKEHFDKQKADGSRFVYGLMKLGNFAVGRHRWVLSGTFVVVALSVLLITQLKVGSTMVGYFKEDMKSFRPARY